MSSSTHFSPKPEEADRGARTSRPTEGTRISLVLTMDKDKRPLHLVRSTGPRGTAQKEGRQAAWHCSRGVAFGESSASLIHLAGGDGDNPRPEERC